MEKFTYLLFLLVFTIPAVALLYLRHRAIVKQYYKLFLPAISVFVVYALLADPIGTSWKAWVYDTRFMIGTWIGGASYETLILAIVLAIIFSLIVIIFAEKEEKKKPFRPFI